MHGNTIGVLGPVLFTALLSVPFAAGDEPEQLARCQSYKDKIEKYTELRRRGGGSGQMDSWRRQRNEYNDRFSAEKCKRFRRRLK